MELLQLQYFQAVARTGNITQAAKELLYLSAPASAAPFPAWNRVWALPSLIARGATSSSINMERLSKARQCLSERAV